MKKISDIIFSIFFSLFIIIGVVRFTVGFKDLFYFDVDYLNIPKISNLSREEIILNYDYLIDYNLSKEESDFEMPTIKSSLEGKIHFEEVRDIFQAVDKMLLVCFIVSIIGVFIKVKEKNIKVLGITSKALISIPLILSLPVIINFEDSFVIFHKIMFDNDYWIFDPQLDPVITMLPEKFFFHAGLMILSLILLFSVIIYSTYRFLRKREQ